MAFTEGGHETDLNGTTAVECTAAPASGVRRLVRSIHVCNVDTAAATIVVYKKKGATSRELARETLSPGEYWTFDRLTILDATDESITCATTAAITTTNPTVDAAYADTDGA